MRGELLVSGTAPGEIGKLAKCIVSANDDRGVGKGVKCERGVVSNK